MGRYWLARRQVAAWRLRAFGPLSGQVRWIAPIRQSILPEMEDTAAGTRALAANDIAMTEGDAPVAGIVKLHNASCVLVGRRGIR